MMHSRAADLIQELELQPHPEGGYFREVFRSVQEVRPIDERPPRSALTTIYFLLVRGQHTHWHRVLSDEVWHFYEGEPLDVFWIDQRDHAHHEVLSGDRHVCVVPAGCWQTARPVGSYALAGCTVGPGFDFQDFELITEASPMWEKLQQIAGVPQGLD
jgi:hypothetical protein